MAERRCFHRKIIESDAFYQLPTSAQILYVHLCMAADDDGFINCASSLAARRKSGRADLKRLTDMRFLLRFGEIYVVKHWRISNSLQNDRMKPPAYPSVAMNLFVKPDRGYTDHPAAGAKSLWEMKMPSKPESKLESNSDSQQNRTEQRITEPNRTEAGFGAREVFVKLFDGYPEARRGSKKTAWESFCKCIHSAEDGKKLLQSLESWKASSQWSKEGGQFVPKLENFLERGIWRTAPGKLETPWGASGKLGDAEMEAIAKVLGKGGTKDGKNGAGA